MLSELPIKFVAVSHEVNETNPHAGDPREKIHGKVVVTDCVSAGHGHIGSKLHRITSNSGTPEYTRDWPKTAKQTQTAVVLPEIDHEVADLVRDRADRTAMRIEPGRPSDLGGAFACNLPRDLVLKVADLVRDRAGRTAMRIEPEG